MLKQFKNCKCVVQNVVEVSLVWWIVRQAEDRTIRRRRECEECHYPLLPTNEWKNGPSGC